MATLVDPEYFGCANKLPFSENFKLSQSIGSNAVGDFSYVKDAGIIAFSIDRVYQCSTDENVFAAIAINHVINDTNVGLAKPVQAAIAFDYAKSISSEERALLAEAFNKELALRGIALGKCHSSRAAEDTSVTIGIISKDPLCSFPAPNSGKIFLSRPLGLFKLHYLREMGADVGREYSTDLLTAVFPIPYRAQVMSVLSDVSGHGLAGTIYSIAQRYQLDVHLSLNPLLCAHPLVIDTPMPCFQNAISHFDFSDIAIDEEAWRLAGLMETAGPMVGFLNDDTDCPDDPFGSGYQLPLGRFGAGTGKVVIEWTA